MTDAGDAAVVGLLSELVGIDSVNPSLVPAPLWQALCPTLVCGPSGGGLHATDEWVDLGQVFSFTRALVEVLSGAD